MANTTDITDMTDAAFDVFMAAKADPEGTVDADHLTVEEREQIAVAMGWDLNEGFVRYWVRG